VDITKIKQLLDLVMLHSHLVRLQSIVKLKSTVHSVVGLLHEFRKVCVLIFLHRKKASVTCYYLLLIVTLSLIPFLISLF
jgi:hypothetical protein